MQYSNYTSFKGIPYAAPPVGDLRWTSPQPVSKWSQPLEAFEFAPACPQDCHLPPHFCPTRQAEDCLHVNVFSPNISDGRKRPVMVFFAGGAFFQGDGGTAIYRGDYFTPEADVVLVTGSYRLGALGFLVTNELAGNYGIEDQLEVLKWVQRNIGSFGGDADQVTIFGESAGAESVGVHLTSPASKGLFRAAIMESNPLSLEFKPVHAARSLGWELAGSLGCGEIDIAKQTACLRSKSPEEVVAAQGSMIPIEPILHFNLSVLLQWTPTVGTPLLPMQPLAAMRAGNFHRVPIVIGSNTNEGRLFVYEVLHSPLPYVEYMAAIAIIFGTKVIEVFEEYPVSLFEHDTRPVFARLLTDYLFACPSRHAAAAMAQSTPVHMYVDTHVLSFPQAYGPNYAFCDDWVCHGTELPILFATYRLPEWDLNYTSGEVALSNAMQSWWGNIAYALDPNSGPDSVPFKWLPFDSSNLNILNLHVPPSMDTAYIAKTCDFWDKVGYNF